ncbi:Uncharacterised protein [Kingella potus]|uniref:Lipoprotein n=2 Tax=Kingella potus TaxID=265175 RepID=A0A377R2N2_9NEIS|nr:hypothetical protein [Kingella potus]STR02761.1 Uncharacterised protein [Kingella potus]
MKAVFTLAAALLLASCVVPVPVPEQHDNTGNTNNTGHVGIIAVPVPIVIGKTKNSDADKPVYVCRLTAFTTTFRAEGQSRGKARLAVKKQCLKENNELFCGDEKISCTEYD